MSEHRDGRLPVRSKLAVAVLMGGLAFGAVWVLALAAFAARALLALL